MIKIALRRNLIYPLQLIIWNLIRKLETILVGNLFNFSNSLIYTPLMFIGEFISGLGIYLYQKKFLKKKKRAILYKTLSLRESPDYIMPRDRKYKIYFLIFMASFFDWIQFMIWTVYVPRYINVSGSIVSRLGGILTITNGLFSYYALRLPILRHQLFSLIVIVICLIIIISTEYLFQEIDVFLTYKEFTFMMILVFICEAFGAYIDCVEKYLYEYNFYNHYITLMLEGIFGFIASFLCFCVPKYGQDLINVYKNNSAGNNILFTFLLLLYIILSGGRNIFRVITTKLYSPMARGLTDYFLNPLYISYDFGMKNDFLNKGERNIPYFIINLMLSIIISFCGCINNEFLILFFCGLDHETHHQISQRATSGSELILIVDDNDSIDGVEF